MRPRERPVGFMARPPALELDCRSSRACHVRSGALRRAVPGVCAAVGVRPPGKAPLGGGRACSVPQLGPARAGGIDPTHRFSRPAASRRAGRPPSPGRGRFRVPRHGWLSPGVRRNACLAVRMSQPRQVDVSGSAQRSFATRSAGQSQGNLAGYPFESVTYRDMLSRILHQKAACPRPRPPCPLRAAALTRHGARAQPSTDRCAASMCALQSL